MSNKDRIEEIIETVNKECTSLEAGVKRHVRRIVKSRGAIRSDEVKALYQYLHKKIAKIMILDHDYDVNGGRKSK